MGEERGGGCGRAKDLVTIAAQAKKVGGGGGCQVAGGQMCLQF